MPYSNSKYCRCCRAIAYYHARAQPRSRSLKGQSPNQALSSAIAEGWAGAPEVDPLALRVAFSCEDTRLIHGGGYVSWNGKSYFDDTLIARTGQRLTIRFAKWDERYLFVFDECNQLICAAQEAQHFAFFGEDGARTQAQRTKVLKRYLHGLRGNTVRLDLQAAMQRRTELAEPAPEVQLGPCIQLTPTMSSMLLAVKDHQAQALHTSTSSRRPPITTSQWSTPLNAWLPALAGPEDPDDECTCVLEPERGEPEPALAAHTRTADVSGGDA